MNDECLIRSATADDIPSIVSLWRELTDFHVKLDSYCATSADAEDRMAEWVGNSLDDDDSIVLVAQIGDTIAGYLLAKIAERPPVMAERRYAMIFDVSVTSHLRRQGIGERLVREAVRLIEERGIRHIEVNYTLANKVSSAFWPKMGFRPFLQRGRLDI